MRGHSVLNQTGKRSNDSARRKVSRSRIGEERLMSWWGKAERGGRLLMVERVNGYPQA